MVEKDSPVLHGDIPVFLAKDAVEFVPPAKIKKDFYSPYFIVPKKGSGSRPILDLHVINGALHRLPYLDISVQSLPFQSVPVSCIFTKVAEAAIDPLR